MNKFSITALLAILTVSTCVYGQAPAKQGKQGEKPIRMKISAEALKEFDKDGDGKLSPEERTAMKAANKAKAAKKANGAAPVVAAPVVAVPAK